VPHFDHPAVNYICNCCWHTHKISITSLSSEHCTNFFIPDWVIMKTSWAAVIWYISQGLGSLGKEWSVGLRPRLMYQARRADVSRHSSLLHQNDFWEDWVAVLRAPKCLLFLYVLLKFQGTLITSFCLTLYKIVIIWKLR